MALEPKEKNEILALVFKELKDVFEDDNVLTPHIESEEIQELRKTIRNRLANRLHELEILDDLERMS
jgi:hypothetical protein